MSDRDKPRKIWLLVSFKLQQLDRPPKLPGVSGGDGEECGPQGPIWDSTCNPGIWVFGTFCSAS